MEHVRRVVKVSERRACQVLGQARSTHRYRSRRETGDAVLVARMKKLRVDRKRFGYRRIWSLLRREGWRVNRKRVHRIWKAEGWQIVRQSAETPGGGREREQLRGAQG